MARWETTDGVFDEAVSFASWPPNSPARVAFMAHEDSIAETGFKEQTQSL